MSTIKTPVIFCDFDGTITEKDNIIAIMKHFNPSGWEPIVASILNQEMSIRDGVGQLFALLPSTLKEEIIQFTLDQAIIREGFSELLAYCQQVNIPFYVTSGGIDFFVYRILASFAIPHDHIYCNGSDFSGDTIRILWPHRCDEYCNNDCGMCKTKIARTFAQEEYMRIVIGDSVTDFEAAKMADLVFARSHLLEQCTKLNIPYVPFKTFYEVIEKLKELDN